MALEITLEDLIKATLPAGWGFVGFLGVSPQGSSYRRLCPVDLEAAQVICQLGEAAGPWLGASEPGWLWYYCPTYQPPVSPDGPPDRQSLVAARRQRALATGRQMQAWARRQGWWLRIDGDF